MHDVSQAKFSSYTTATGGGTGIQPLGIYSNKAVYGGAKINCLAWSHNNQIISHGYDDGQIVLTAAASNKKVHTIQANLNNIVAGGA